MDGNQNQRATDAHLVGAAAVDEAVASRRSIRRFLPTPVSREMVDHLLTVASRAPSGTNMQPWQVCALAGKQKAALQDALVDASLNHGEEHAAEFPYYPEQFPEPYKSRRRKIGWDLYGLLDITRADKDKMRQQMARNFLFFDAPVGLIFTIDRVLEIGSWLDYGMFMENIIAAWRRASMACTPARRSRFPKYHTIIRRHLDIPDEQIVICGMSIGYADLEAIENTLDEPNANRWSNAIHQPAISVSKFSRTPVRGARRRTSNRRRFHGPRPSSDYAPCPVVAAVEHHGALSWWRSSAKCWDTATSLPQRIISPTDTNSAPK